MGGCGNQFSAVWLVNTNNADVRSLSLYNDSRSYRTIMLGGGGDKFGWGCPWSVCFHVEHQVFRSRAGSLH